MKKKLMKNSGLFLKIFLIIIALIGSYYFIKDKRMSDNWMAPYLSAANNLQWAGDFRINIDEVNRFKELNSIDQDNYRFSSANNLVHYNHNPIGYVYLIKGASLIFPFVGDQMAIVLLQCLVFILINILFLTLNNFSTKQKWLFFFLFSINPLVLRFVPFNFYYFWQLIPSVLFGYLVLSKNVNLFVLSLLVFITPFIVLTRPTVIFALVILVFLLFKKASTIYALGSLIFIITISFFLFQPVKKNIWHTIYTGVGAYSNSYNIELSDDSTYKLYEEYTGDKLDASIGGNYYETKVIDKYAEITKSKTLELIDQSPFLFLKNAIVNTLQGFSIGYVNKAGDSINYLIALSGLVLIGIMLFSKKYIWILMIGFSIGSFTLYYPPIQAYMYGVYLLLVLFIVSMFFNSNHNIS